MINFLYEVVLVINGIRPPLIAVQQGRLGIKFPEKTC